MAIALHLYLASSLLLAVLLHLYINYQAMRSNKRSAGWQQAPNVHMPADPFAQLPEQSVLLLFACSGRALLSDETAVRGGLWLPAPCLRAPLTPWHGHGQCVWIWITVRNDVCHDNHDLKSD